VFSDVVTEFLCTTKYGCIFADRFYCKYSSVLILEKGHLQSIPCGSAMGTLGISFSAATTFF
jgi:hypothetical protein